MEIDGNQAIATFHRDIDQTVLIQVIERGSHHELVELGGKYAELWKIQNREEEVEDNDHGGGGRGGGAE